MHFYVKSALLLALAAASGWAQGRKEPFDYTGPERVSRVPAPPPGIRLGMGRPREFALALLNGSERALLAKPGLRKTTGVHRALAPEALHSGAWQTARDGTRVWRMAIRSPGSNGIRLEFHNFSVGGGKVWIHDGANSVGPYTGRGIFDNGVFWSAPVASESVIVEYEPEPGAAIGATLPFEVATITHIAGYATAATDPADYCHLDPNCYSEWQPAMKMVGQLMFEDSGAQYACSGTLVSTRDNSLKPYLLTAGHCIHSEDAARSLVVSWNFQTTACGAPPPTSMVGDIKSVGGHLLGFGTIDQGDYSLVMLQDIPAGVTFAGWDPSDPPIDTSLTGIHHPAASWKRISFGNRAGDQTVDVEGTIAPGSKYLQVQWSQGRTEPGSSGSALFSSPGMVTGTLTYGPASNFLSACEIAPSVDGYGRFSNTYQALQGYFENLPTSLVTPAQSNLNFNIDNHLAPPAQLVSLTTQSTGQVTYKLRADAPWIVLSSITGTASAKTPVPAQISVDASQLRQPGQYTSTVTILSGAAPPQFINVTVKVQASLSNVVLSVSPNPAHQINGVWTFTMRLDETAGAATTVTGVHINGVDYSDNLRGWFGATHINANASLMDTLQASGLATGNQVFEFWGVDDGSGQTWYRSLVVNFQ